MSNEELAVEIQAGAIERMGELWEQVRRFVAMKARHVMTALEGRADVELDDLIQSGYLALVEAVADYKPEQGAFLTVLGYHLKSAFAEATHFRTLRQQRETLARPISLDSPVGDDTDACPLGDLIADPTGTARLEDAEERIYQEQLQKTVAAVLADLTEEHRELLRLRFWEGATLQKIAMVQGVTKELVRKKENNAIRELRRPRNASRLEPFHNFDPYNGTGLNAFRHTGLSVQERYPIQEERRKERKIQKAKERKARRRQEEERRVQEFENSLNRANQMINEYLDGLSPQERASFEDDLAQIRKERINSYQEV